MKVIIPAYEPDEKLLTLIKNIQENSYYGIIVVNDGSASKCAFVFEKAREAGCTILTHDANLGKGAALKTAFTYALQSKEEDGLVCADCDGQHTWQDIIKIGVAIPFHNKSIIMGCREFVGKVPLKSMLGNKITRGIFSLISGCKISDTQTGLRGFSSEMLPWLVQLKGHHYEYEMNQLLEAKSAGYQLFSVPIQTIYENNNATSHFHPIRDSIRIYLPIIKFSLSSISCGIIDFILLFFFNWITNNLLAAVVLARACSSLCNYYLNKNMVFESKGKNHRSSFIKYYALVATILVCNYLLLSFFVNIVGITLFFGKILTECILFIFSFFIQHKFIFHKNQVVKD